MNSIINNELESCSDRTDIKLNHSGAISRDLGIFQRQTRPLNEAASLCANSFYNRLGVIKEDFLHDKVKP